MEGDVRPDLNNRDGVILCIEASQKYEEWYGIREIGKKIEKKAKDVGQDLKLDNLTRGAGDCFPISILQQLNRNEIHQNLDSKLKEISSSINHIEFRTKVVAFMLKSKLPHLLSYRKQVEENVGTKWNGYCRSMIKKGAYVDNYFVQCTAWYLKMDLWIFGENGTRTHPFMKISGNEEAGSSTPILYIGLADEHYQSLLPLSMEEEDAQEEETQSDYSLKMNACPICGKDSKLVLMHISRSKLCKEAFGEERLKEVLEKSRKKSVNKSVSQLREKKEGRKSN